MLRERDGVQMKMHCITMEDLVPEDHFLRKLEAAEIGRTSGIPVEKLIELLKMFYQEEV